MDPNPKGSFSSHNFVAEIFYLDINTWYFAYILNNFWAYDAGHTFNVSTYEKFYTTLNKCGIHRIIYYQLSRA